jgi:hypothetical protein
MKAPEQRWMLRLLVHRRKMQVERRSIHSHCSDRMQPELLVLLLALQIQKRL